MLWVGSRGVLLRREEKKSENEWGKKGVQAVFCEKKEKKRDNLEF